METKLHAIGASLTNRRAVAATVVDLNYPDLTVPDYTTLYPLPPHTGDLGAVSEQEAGYGCSNWEHGPCGRCDLMLTPRLAYLLHTGAELAKDTFNDSCGDAEHGELSTGHLNETLPRPVLRYLDRLPEADAAVWLGCFAATFEVIKARIAVGEVPLPRSTAEEMALHIVINEAEYWLESILFDDLEDRVFDALPDDGPRDHDVRRLLEILFEDHDVLWLFNPEMDGIDDDTGEVAERLGTAHLHARYWYRSFRPDTDPAPELLVASPGDTRRQHHPSAPR